MARTNPLVLIRKIAVDALRNPRDTAGKVVSTVSQIPIPGRRTRATGRAPAAAPAAPAPPAAKAAPPVRKAAPPPKPPAAKADPSPKKPPDEKAPATKGATNSHEVEVTPADVAKNVHKRKPAPAPAVPGDKLPPRRRTGPT